jgi:radical SAM protein with 4Fe4S-binding SPASM domain
MTGKMKHAGRLSRIARSRGERLHRLPLELTVRYLDPERPRHFPRLIQIEATSKCNLRCPSCSHSRESGSGRHLTPEGLERMLDRLPSAPPRVRLSGIGEPLLNPDFLALVDTLTEREIKCDFITNGTLLTPRTREALLARSGIDGLVISCDGARKSTFESCRLGARFETWSRNVRDFLTEAKRQRGRTLGVSSSTVISRQNIGELGDIVRFAADLGFDGVTILAPIPVDDVAASLCPSPEEMSAVNQEELEKTAEEAGVGISCVLGHSDPAAAATPHCMQPWEYVFIRENGAVAPCCALFGSGKGAVMGNVLEQDFDDVWRGDRFRDFRRTSASGTNQLCRVCPYY